MRWAGLPAKSVMALVRSWVREQRFVQDIIGRCGCDGLGGAAVSGGAELNRLLVAGDMEGGEGHGFEFCQIPEVILGWGDGGIGGSGDFGDGNDGASHLSLDAEKCAEPELDGAGQGGGFGGGEDEHLGMNGFFEDGAAAVGRSKLIEPVE